MKSLLCFGRWMEAMGTTAGVRSPRFILCWVGLGQERMGERMENRAWSVASAESFCICVMHPYLCLCSIYLLFLSVSSSPSTSSWLWHVLHCLVLDMSFVLTFALRFAIWSIISCFLILAPPSSHLPSGCSTFLLALKRHLHNYVVPYTAGGFVISLENKDAMRIKALVLMLPSQALDKFFGTIFGCYHHFLQKVFAIDLLGTFLRVAEFSKWMRHLPTRSIRFQMDSMRIHS